MADVEIEYCIVCNTSLTNIIHVRNKNDNPEAEIFFCPKHINLLLNGDKKTMEAVAIKLNQ